jgi:hypothetical protein
MRRIAAAFLLPLLVLDFACGRQPVTNTRSTPQPSHTAPVSATLFNGAVSSCTLERGGKNWDVVVSFQLSHSAITSGLAPFPNMRIEDYVLQEVYGSRVLPETGFSKLARNAPELVIHLRRSGGLPSELRFVALQFSVPRLASVSGPSLEGLIHRQLQGPFGTAEVTSIEIVATSVEVSLTLSPPMLAPGLLVGGTSNEELILPAGSIRSTGRSLGLNGGPGYSERVRFDMEEAPAGAATLRVGRWTLVNVPTVVVTGFDQMCPH